MSNKRVWPYCHMAQDNAISMELQRQRLFSCAEEKGGKIKFCYAALYMRLVKKA